MISRAAGGSGWRIFVLVFRSSHFLYLLCCYVGIWHGSGCSSTHGQATILFCRSYLLRSFAVSPHGHGVHENHCALGLLFGPAADGYISSSVLVTVVLCSNSAVLNHDIDIVHVSCLIGSRAKRLTFCLMSSIRVLVLCRQLVRFLCVVSHWIFRV